MYVKSIGYFVDKETMVDSIECLGKSKKVWHPSHFVTQSIDSISGHASEITTLVSHETSVWSQVDQGAKWYEKVYTCTQSSQMVWRKEWYWPILIEKNFVPCTVMI